MFRNRKNQEPEQKFEDLEKTLSIENLVGTDIRTAFPQSTDKTALSVVDDSGTLYLVITAKGQRGRIAFSSF